MAISWIVFAAVCAGAVLGMSLRAALPDHYQSSDSKDALKLLAGLIGTMSALVIGLLIATAASSFGTRRGELMQMSTNIVLLDRGLAHYGSETGAVRDLLRASVIREIKAVWPEPGSAPDYDPVATGTEGLYDKIQELQPRNDIQRSLKEQMLTVAINLGQARWLLFAQADSSIPTPFLVVLTFWFSFIFATFGLLAPPNPAVVVGLLLGALSVAAAVLLILELDRPFEGLIQLSSAPLRNALAHLGH